MTNRRPVDHVRIGAIDAAIWQNEGPRGRPNYNVTLQRAYRDSETGEWGNTTSFGRDDLLTLAKVADAAHTRICELQTLDRVAKDKREATTNATSEGEPAPGDEPEDHAVGAMASAGTGPAEGAGPTRLKAKAKARTENAR